ncbi:M56 family metallopeptidase [Anaeromicropila herbilytica]|uniref:Peptidase M56 domain-containing protein n=1 Tax=Anaeromicropila herbilytica TaxID=2785025 RepID=A0A7R7IBB0_9FIRM|nr:M56 family metallopeptidase [Anaeromicropila herbilytica]BCN29347.1 hypothetical protein bsdtb5_06420 [Anaeromicropila herbilytica]
MIDVFKTILAMSLSGAALIVILYLLRPLANHTFSKAWQYYIWLIVCVRLIIPFSPDFGALNTVFQNTHKVESTTSSNASLGTNTYKEGIQEGVDSKADSNGAITGKNQLTKDDVNTTIRDSKDTNLSKQVSNDTLANNINDSTVKGNNEQSFLNLWTIGAFVWLAGVLFLLVRKAIQYIKFVSFVYKDREPVVNQTVLASYTKVGIDLKIKKKPRIYRDGKIGSPMLIGIVKPSIYLPDHTLGMDEESLNYILRHELIHYKRYDYLYKWFCEFILITHWFNPFVYLMSRRINEECEISCDEAVVRDLGKEEKFIYGNILLKAAQNNNYSRSVLSTTLCEDKKGLQKRLGTVAHAKRKSNIIIICSTCTAFIICLVAIFLGTYSMHEKLEGKSNQKETQVSTNSTNNSSNTNNKDSNIVETVNTDDNVAVNSNDKGTNNSGKSNRNVNSNSSENTDTKKDHIVKSDISVKYVKASVGMGNITLKYNTKNEYDITANYETSGKLKYQDIIKKLIKKAELTTDVSGNELEISIRTKDTKKDIWNYINEKYNNKNLNFSANLTILIPKNMQKIDLDTSMGNINVKDIGGEVTLDTSMGNIYAKNINFTGKSEMDTSMGNIYCTVSKDISEESNVSLDSSMGNIVINSNSLKSDKKDGSDFLSDSMKVVINGLCNIDASTSMGDISLK